MRRALAYVLNNARRHGIDYKGIDYYASGWWFKGWSGGTLTIRGLDGVATPVATPRGRWLRDEWHLHGLIHMDEVPGRFALP